MRLLVSVSAVCAWAALTCPASAQDFAARCQALASQAGVSEAHPVGAGPLELPGPTPLRLDLPAHCLVRGALNPRTGIDGKPYAIGYEMRLPADWNGKFVFQGGGGSDGVVRPAIGIQATGEVPALTKGYAIASTDAGHRDEPGPTGPYQFGLDPQARIDKGYHHIPVVTAQANALMHALYDRDRSRAYFVGCSNGGRQGMAATQRYPDLFDGVVAGAPAYRVPRAAIAGMAAVQTLAAIAPKGADGRPDLGAALSKADLKLIGDRVTQACDAADGLSDGMVNNVKACRFDVMALTCREGQNGACLAPEKAKAVDRIFRGETTADGSLIYATWPYDPGVAYPGWTAWILGNPGKSPPDARNVSLVPGSVAYYFSTPPEHPTDLYAYTLNFDLARGLRAIVATQPPFDESGWSIEAALSPDIDRFKARGGKIVFYHGMADPIFSSHDTVAYLDALGARYGDAAGFSRLYLVPGMNHCIGGPATDQFDALTALDRWVEAGDAPQALVAKARATPDVAWPGRTRPLCPYPSYAAYQGTGDTESASSFACRAP